MQSLLERIGPVMQALVSVLVMVSFIATVGVLLATLFGYANDIPTGVKEVLLVLTGVLAGSYKEVVGFWLGSSYGSARKTDAMVNSSPASKAVP